MMANTLLPVGPLVAAAWLKTLPVLASVTVTQSLPDVGAWTSDLAVTVAIVGGPVDAYVPMRSPTVQVDVWGKSAGDSRRVPWNRCFEVADQIREATYAGTAKTVTLAGPEYRPARVTDVRFDAEPRRLTDPSGLARVVMQIQLTYLVD